jgi:nucleoid-associated protein YgaU
LSGVPPVPNGRVHRVEEGETLTSIAVQYYGDGDAAKVSLLFSSNRDRLMAPDRLPAGTLLVVPVVGKVR